MKALRISTLAIVISILALSSTLFASTPETEKTKVEKNLKNFLLAMSCENTGVVESSIIICVELKALYPQYDLKKVEDKLNSLAVDGETPVIRYRALLASLYYSNYPIFANLKIVDKDNPEKTFRAIIDRIENYRVASN
ncbi:MAG: hypothetical protein A2499_13855 [Stygiobacter sp. RIFOXYC12_FULL_38_8]|nr:MAG: hypothetical protein FD188_188 [Ignavibacteria bacterium]OGU67982.1 MAG: hypothetical protein A2X62_02050 [Stygiobacter sp. GWC2_38_9]OGU79375.1 MAG: hypothetical protein A2279_00760 [Stygiobacter sp. RIFOXYA12_FULL_38_9]OGV07666.1 MAG: hypothetical protein A2299_05775 [Stygiobacter sp. RIFOXYB2_FULL_37_11]OGV10828.1 MAG: hypothetical protein A2237_00655 [Stygiobacter sp. RIFOXYA2_FULL_38_8]OGV12669.1 MAG: hypothetical protein A2440_15610 [Stygiobacter sp. RIFOXYC2_FULL_38_25]OGV26927